MKLNKKETKWLKIVLMERLTEISENFESLDEFRCALYKQRNDEEQESIYSILSKLIKE
jgi:hypothetical protein